MRLGWEWKRNWQLKVLALVMALLLWVVYGGGRDWWRGLTRDH